MEEGLAVRETVLQEGRPNLHLHHLTAAGEDALRAWLDSPLKPEVTREPFLARLFFAGKLPPSGVVNLLERRRAEVAARLHALEQIEVPDPAEVDLPEFLRLATREHGMVHARAELAWIEAVLEHVQERWG